MSKKDNFPFADSPDTATFVCRHVLSGEKPVLMVTHDEDGYWQFLCGGIHTEEDARIVSLRQAYELDTGTAALSGLGYGQSAERKDPDSDWTVS